MNVSSTKIAIGLASMMMLSAIGLSAPATAQGTPVEYVIGFHAAPGLDVGDPFYGGTVTRVTPAINAVTVASSSASFKTNAQTDANVRYVEQNGRYEATYTPNDPYWSSQYGPQRVNADDAWDITRGAVTGRVCIVDTGVRYTHQEFTGRYLGGFDFVNNDNDAWDDHYHGTHVAGTAAAAIDNGAGIAGMANVAIYAAKVLDAWGSGWWDDVAAGIVWCADQAPNMVISLSLGGWGYSQAVQDAVSYAYDIRGALIVAAAGNSGCDDCVLYPARFEEVMAVSCTDSGDNICWFSSRGPSVEIAAPGYSILSTMSWDDFAYGHLSGTSMSTPHVSGAAALYWSLFAGVPNVVLRECLVNTANDMGPAGRDNAYGYGLLDTFALMTLCVPTPSGEVPIPQGDNDNWASARIIFDTPYSNGQNTAGATDEPGEPRPCGGISRTVWYSYTPLQSGRVVVDTYGSNFDTVAAAYAGSPQGPVVACNDDWYYLQSHIAFDAIAGTTYYLQFGGYNGRTGDLRVNVQCDGCDLPLNDGFAAAEALGSAPSAVDLRTTGATTESGEPLSCGAMGSTVWYSWVAPSSGNVELDTFTSAFDTVLAVHTGSGLGSLTTVACNDDSSSTLQSKVAFAAVAGQTYWIQAGGSGRATGPLVLHLQCAGCLPGTAPANDDFDDAASVRQNSFTHTVATGGATTETGEPSPCGAIGKTVWYTVTPVASGTITVSTGGSDFDTVLAAYTGPADLASQTLVACNDDHGGAVTSQVRFGVEAGRTYYIQAGGYHGASGTLQLDVDCGLACVASGTVSNDEISGAKSIVVTPYSTMQSTVGATRAPGESAQCETTGSTVWFKHAPTVPKVLSATTQGSTFDAVLNVYVDIAGVLVPLGCNDNFPGLGSQARVNFVALPGFTYYIQAGGANGATGTLSLGVQ